MTNSLLGVRRGSQTPRVSSFPTFTSTAGQDAIELAESAGLVLDPWQRHVLLVSLGETRGAMWTAPDVGLVVPRQNGKGSVLEARELAGLFLFGESILHTSHEFKTSMDHYRRLERLIQSTPDLLRKVHSFPKAPGTEGIVMPDGRALRFMARTKGSGRGFPADVVIFDEAFALTDDQMAALMPTMSSRPNPQSWYTSSPPLDGISGEVLVRLHARGAAGSAGLAWFDWGAANDVDPDDVDQWYATNPALGYRLTEESIRRERAAMSDEAFARERLGVWPREDVPEWQVFTRQQWKDCRDDESILDGTPALSVVLSESGEWATVIAAGRRSDGLFHAEIVDRRQGGAWVVPRVVDLVGKWAPYGVVINKGTPAGMFVPELTEAGVEVTPISTRDSAAAAGALLAAVKEGRFRHRGDPVLTVSAAKADKHEFSSTWEFELTAGSVDISPISGAANALWGYTTRAPAAQPFFGAYR